MINTSASQHATVAVPGVSRVIILKKKQVVFAPPQGQSATLKGEFPFAIQFPHNLDAYSLRGANASVGGSGGEPLPPSYTVYQPGISTEISYSFRVDIVRKGLRRHEKYACLTLRLVQAQMR